jgi:hypothetical protein
MLELAQKKPKTIKEEPVVTITTLEQAETFLRKLDEWYHVSRMDREIILNWANFLKNKGITK